MVTVVANPDVSTTTPTTTTVLLGDVDLVGLEQIFVNKTKGQGTALVRGLPLVRDNSVTPNVFKAAVAADIRPIVVTGLPTNTWDYANPTRCCGDNDTRMQVIVKGKVVLKAGGAIQPGAKVQCAASNKVVVWDGTAGKDIGVYLGKPGTLGGNVTSGAAADDDLIWVEFNGGAY